MTFQLPTQLKTLWDKFTGWFSGEVKTAETLFTAEEQKILAAFAPILHAAEPVTLAALIDLARSVLSSGLTASSLADWEAHVLNAAEATGGQLFTVAKGLGSNLLQALIGVLLADLTKVA